jgi:hypothetical protein
MLAGATYDVSSAITARSVAVRGSTVAVSGGGSVVNYDLSLGQRYAVFSAADAEVALDPAGNTLATGGTTLRLGPDGTLQWQHAGEGSWIRVDDSGDSYVGGARYTRNLFVRKYDGSGDLAWTQTWAGEEGRASPSCFTLGADGVYIGGRIGTHGRAILIKYAR